MAARPGDPGPSGGTYVSGLQWTSAGCGVTVPALAWFSSYAPPLFPEAGIILTALCGFLVGVVWLRGNTTPLTRVAKHSVRFMTAAILFLLVYVVVLSWWSTPAPLEATCPVGKCRFQVGFGLMPWGLSEVALKWLGENPGATVEDLMLAFAAYQPRGPEALWKPWTVYLTGFTMLVVFFLAFVFWTLSFALLARGQADTPGEAGASSRQLPIASA